MGAYLQVFSTAVPSYLYACLLAGQYATPAIYCDVQAGFTNTGPVDAYRGAGRPESIYLLERTVEAAARELEIEPAELRRRNFIPPDAMPFTTAIGATYDSGDFPRNLEIALDRAGRGGFLARKAESAARGERAAQKAVTTAERAVEEARGALATARASGEAAETIDALEQAIIHAEQEVERCKRKAAKARAKASLTAVEAQSLTGEEKLEEADPSETDSSG